MRSFVAKIRDASMLTEVVLSYFAASDAFQFTYWPPTSSVAYIRMTEVNRSAPLTLQLPEHLECYRCVVKGNRAVREDLNLLMSLASN